MLILFRVGVGKVLNFVSLEDSKCTVGETSLLSVDVIASRCSSESMDKPNDSSVQFLSFSVDVLSLRSDEKFCSLDSFEVSFFFLGLMKQY